MLLSVCKVAKEEGLRTCQLCMRENMFACVSIGARDDRGKKAVSTMDEAVGLSRTQAGRLAGWRVGG